MSRFDRELITADVWTREASRRLNWEFFFSLRLLMKVILSQSAEAKHQNH